LIIKVQKDSEEILVSFIKKLDRIFKDANCKEQSTVDDWKFSRFLSYCKEHEEWTDWVLKSEEGTRLLYRRWFYDDKSVNIKKICELYPEDANNVRAVDKKEYKKWIASVMEPLDNFFIELGNSIIELCDGILNQDSKAEIVKKLKTDLEDAVSEIELNGDDDANQKMTKQLTRLEGIGLNATEGIVFRYKGKLMKCTGSFAALNQLLGMTKFNR
jgi:hypothetical protein